MRGKDYGSQRVTIQNKNRGEGDLNDLLRIDANTKLYNSAKFIDGVGVLNAINDTIYLDSNSSAIL
jgi:hypothetical protein